MNTPTEVHRLPWLQVIGLALLMQVVLLLSVTAMTPLLTALLGKEGLAPILTLHVSIIAASVLTFFGYGSLVQRWTGTPTALGDRRPIPLLLGCALGLTLALAATGLTGLIAEGLTWLGQHVAAFEFVEPMLNQREAGFEHLLLLDRDALIPLVLLTIAVLPALGEEFFFRGVLQGIVRHSSERTQIIGIGLIFGLVHFDLVGLIPLVLVGMVLALLRLRAGGWLLPVTTHFLLNAFNGVIGPRVFPESLDTPAAYLALLVLGAGASLPILRQLTGPSEAVS